MLVLLQIQLCHFAHKSNVIVTIYCILLLVGRISRDFRIPYRIHGIFVLIINTTFLARFIIQFKTLPFKLYHLKLSEVLVMFHYSETIEQIPTEHTHWYIHSYYEIWLTCRLFLHKHFTGSKYFHASTRVIHK